FHAANCTFRRIPDHSICVWLEPTTKKCVLRNCGFYGPFAALGGYFGTESQNVIDNCIVGGGFGSHVYATQREVSLRVAHATLIGGPYHGPDFHLDEWPKALAEQSVRTFRLDMSSSVFGPYPVVRIYQDKDALVDGKPLPPAEVEDRLRRMVSWHGEHNLFSMGPGSDQKETFQFLSGAWRGERNLQHGPTDLAAWRKFWNSPETGSLVTHVRYQGGNLIDLLATEPDKVGPEDCRLRPDTPGYRAGRDGKDLGADRE